jgi:hypothetical protein
MKLVIFFLFLTIPAVLYAQKTNEKDIVPRIFHFSVSPGLSTNGVKPGKFYNVISVNLTTSHSAGFRFMELSGISSFTRFSSTGLCFSGLTNVVGGDAASKIGKDQKEPIPGFHGIQMAGLLNYVAGDVDGAQLSLGFNHSRANFTGIQFGLGNVNYGFILGIQASVLVNVTNYTSGLQASTLLNISKTNLFGFQIGPFNYVKTIYGPKSSTDLGNGIQIGLINISNEMDGWQFGLINVSRRSTKGTQIGLINFFRGNVDGTPIGLLNVGRPYATLRVWTSDLFLTNYGVGLGSKKVQNTLFYSFNPFATRDQPLRAIGYGLDRIYSRSTNKQIEAGVNVTIFKKQDDPVMMFSPKGTLCFHITRGIYWTAGISMNILWHSETSAGWIDDISFKKESSQIWPSFQLGLLTR